MAPEDEGQEVVELVVCPNCERKLMKPGRELCDTCTLAQYGEMPESTGVILEGET